MGVKVRSLFASTPDDGLNIHLDDIVLFPITWFASNIGKNNLQLTKSLDDLKESSRLSDVVLYDLIMEISTKMFRMDGLAYWLYIVSEHTWKGLRYSLINRVTKHVDANLYLNGRKVGCVPLNEPYSSGSINVTPEAEYEYNKTLYNYFRGKYPIMLKTMCPSFDEEPKANIDVVVKPKSKSTNTSCLTSKDGDRRFAITEKYGKGF